MIIHQSLVLLIFIIIVVAVLVQLSDGEYHGHGCDASSASVFATTSASTMTNHHHHHHHGYIRGGCHEDIVATTTTAAAVEDTVIVQDGNDVHQYDADITSSKWDDAERNSVPTDCNSILVLDDHDEETEVRKKVMVGASVAADSASGIVAAVNEAKTALSSSSDYNDNDTMKNETSLKRKLQTAPSWVERGDSKLVGTTDFDAFGTPSCLSSDGMVLAVGAPYSNGGPGQDSGSVQVFDYSDGSTYNPRGPAIHGVAAGDTFGWSVSLSNNGEILAVGAPISNGVGYVKIYKYDGGKYNEVINITEGDPGALFGYTVSLSGDGKRLGIGAPKASYFISGYAKAFSLDLSAGVATQIFYDGGVWFLNADYGYSISLSDDGALLAVGDVLLSEVYVYQYNGVDYTFLCDKLGDAVTFSGDGTRFAVRNQTSAFVSVYSINAAKQCDQLGQNISISTQSFSGGNYDPTEILMSLSKDGHVLAVANPLNANGVQVYEQKYNVNNQLEYATRGSVISANSTAVSLSDDGNVLAIGVQRRDLGNGQIEDNGSTLVYEWTSQSTNGGPTPSPTPVPTNTRAPIAPTTPPPTVFGASNSPTSPPTPPPTRPPTTPSPTKDGGGGGGIVLSPPPAQGSQTNNTQNNITIKVSNDSSSNSKNHNTNSNKAKNDSDVKNKNNNKNDNKAKNKNEDKHKKKVKKIKEVDKVKNQKLKDKRKDKKRRDDKRRNDKNKKKRRDDKQRDDEHRDSDKRNNSRRKKDNRKEDNRDKNVGSKHGDKKREKRSEEKHKDYDLFHRLLHIFGMV